MIPQEKYFLRVQLIRSNKEGEYISRSFDYEVSPTIDPALQDPLFIRAEKFYKQIQGLFNQAGWRLTVTDKEKLRGGYA